ncbi:hypothetical protein CYMTET_20826 [Cymbomonas tetramitiformis]|uniref:Uncharacterized protein n=1 Tax=Cymbomonas tetramitiformis TaxID=36881 RepID=A0AAE0G388_9CHLO|nr:hypothetical protein CYMTET_20826 [Cymbomonas tetramitiformis]
MEVVQEVGAKPGKGGARQAQRLGSMDVVQEIRGASPAAGTRAHKAGAAWRWCKRAAGSMEVVQQAAVASGSKKKRETRRCIERWRLTLMAPTFIRRVRGRKSTVLLRMFSAGNAYAVEPCTLEGTTLKEPVFEPLTSVLVAAYTRPPHCALPLLEPLSSS